MYAVSVCEPKFTKYCENVQDPSQLKNVVCLWPVSVRDIRAYGRDVVVKDARNGQFLGPRFKERKPPNSNVGISLALSYRVYNSLNVLTKFYVTKLLSRLSCCLLVF